MKNSCVLHLLILLILKEVTVRADFDVKDLTNNEFELDCLLSHNKLREKHCSSQLKYSPKLKTFATRRALEMAKKDGKNFGHVINLPFGENINWHQEKNSSGLLCKSIVELWYSEKLYHNWKPQRSVAMNSRHFTELVWNSTQKVGCAKVAGMGPIGGVFTVCNYYPTANILRNYSHDVMSVEDCDNVLMKHKFKYRELTNGKWLQECIDEHNKIRVTHGVIPLSINDEIFQYSRRRAIDMAEKGFRFFRHIRSTKFGENIHWGKSSNTNHSNSISCKIPIDKWYEELHNYNWNSRKAYNGTIRHFSQLVWKSTLNIGCAQVENIEESRGGVYTVCAYDPKAYTHSIQLQMDNVFPDITKITTTTQLSTVTVKAHHYQDISEEINDETELEKEFKDIDDVIDSRIEYRKQTESPSLEDILKTTENYLNRAYNTFDRNEYTHKKRRKQ